MEQGDGKPARDEPPGQRRQVTVLFADVADFTPLAERQLLAASDDMMRRFREEMPRARPRLNYYFQPSEMVTVGGATVKLDGGFGVVTIDDGGDREEVYFPDQTARYVLVPGEINRLEKKGLAECYGRTWKD